MFTTHPRRARRAVAALSLAVLALSGSADLAGAAPTRRPTPPALIVDGTATWTVGENGDAVVLGPGRLKERGERARPAALAATVVADDETLPDPETCEAASTTLSVDGPRRLNLRLVGDGEVCGYYPQPPTSIATHVFTGTYEVLDGPRRLVGTDGFFEVRLGSDGTASVFAIDT